MSLGFNIISGWEALLISGFESKQQAFMFWTNVSFSETWCYRSVFIFSN